MRYLALAADYDGTLAHHGLVHASTVAALERLRGSGRKLLLVTGRELDELLEIFPAANLFDRIIGENGALIYDPSTKEVRTLAEKPPDAFIEELRKREVAPFSVGHAIVAAWKPHETSILAAIRDMGLELQVIFNKEAVMVLPAGVTKASGLKAALKELELSAHEVVGVGDAENDLAMLAMCECAIAVQNALPTVKERADLVTPEDHGGGVERLIAYLLENDLKEVQSRLKRHHLLLGHRDDGSEIRVAPFACSLLIAGPSGSGKSTACKSFVERLREQRYQYCIVDPEGDYEGLEGAVTIGGNKHSPAVDEILQILKKPNENVVVNLIGMPLPDRPPFFASLLPRLQEMRAHCGRPHWIVVDEAHHLLPAAWEPGKAALPREMDRMVYLTVHPEQINSAALAGIDTVIAVGAEPGKTLEAFCQASGHTPPRWRAAPPEVEAETVTYWHKANGELPTAMKVIRPRAEHRRHIRKYAEGELPAERCFYFRGPDDKLNLKAQNLMLFLQIAAGVDDATWLHHLHQGDYSRWFHDAIHNDELASEAKKVEATKNPTAAETRRQIKDLIERLYTLPASPPMPMPGTDAAPKKA